MGQPFNTIKSYCSAVFCFSSSGLFVFVMSPRALKSSHIYPFIVDEDFRIFLVSGVIVLFQMMMLTRTIIELLQCEIVCA